jgi:hypothetical protein
MERQWRHGRKRARNDEANNPTSPVVKFGPDKPLELAAGVKLAPFQVAYHDLWRIERRQVERRSDLPRADR